MLLSQHLEVAIGVRPLHPAEDQADRPPSQTDEDQDAWNGTA